MLRLLPDLEADGAEQMARDEALLVAAPRPTLRLYRWRPATLSLGCFQDYRAVAATLPGSLPVVRRITGGGAIWHEGEVTYACVGILGEAGWPAQVSALYRLVHAAIAAALARRGVGVELACAPCPDRRYVAEPRCFAAPARDDLVHPAGGKMLGSAARVRGRRCLLHGSLKLTSNCWDGPAVRGCGLTWGEAAAALREAFSAALAAPLIADQWTDAELAAAADIRHQRYGDERWVRERAGPRP